MLYYSCKILPFFGKYKAFTPYAFSNATGSLKAEMDRGFSPSSLAMQPPSRQRQRHGHLFHDPAALAVALDLNNAVHVGHYTENGKVELL